MKIKISEVNILSLIITAGIGLPSAIFFKENIASNTDFKFSAMFWLYTIVGVILHELVHALVAARYAEQGWRNIRFGVMWKYCAFYCHCNEAFTVKEYRWIALMPSILLIFPIVAAFIWGSLPLFLASMVLLGGGAGDFFIVWRLRKESPDTLVIDYRDKVGAAILEPLPESYPVAEVHPSL